MTRVRVSREGAVGQVALARPEKKNALDQATALELREALATLEGDERVRVVLLTGDGEDFCAGADLEALEGMLGATLDALTADAEALGRVFTALRAMRTPVVAAVQGRALAGGAGLATACDIVLAHEQAQFGYPEVRIGFVPAMVMTMLRRAVGEKHAFDLVATGRLLDAEEAWHIGLVSRVLPGTRFASEVQAIVRGIATAPAGAVARTKRLFYELEGCTFEAAVARGVAANVDARLTDDFRDGVRSFTKRERERKDRP